VQPEENNTDVKEKMREIEKVVEVVPNDGEGQEDWGNHDDSPDGAHGRHPIADTFQYEKVRMMRKLIAIEYLRTIEKRCHWHV
jgi:hypothetical protein